MGKQYKTWRKKGLDVACWQDDSGRRSFTLRKQYLNKQSNTWVDTKYLYQDDLRALAEILTEAIEWNSSKSGDREAADLEYRASGAETMMEKLQALTDDDIPF